MSPYMLFIFYWFGVMVCAAASQQSRDTLQVFRSGYRFASDEALRQSQQVFMRSIPDAVKHPFVVEYGSNCDGDCHATMRSYLSSNTQYSAIGAKSGIVHGDIDSMKLILKNNEAVSDIQPLLPDMKVDNDIVLNSECEDSMSDVFLQVVVVGMSSEDLIKFEASLLSLPSDIHVWDMDNLRPDYAYSIVMLTVQCNMVEESAKFLSNMSEVLWVEERKEVKLQMKWANGLTQTGNDNAPAIHAAGLWGKDQIIGISDTGIDNTSCYFFDPYSDFPYDELNLNHRKIVYYDTYGDNVDSTGHGTQVSGVAVGNCEMDSKAGQFNGAAYESKIAFFDIGEDGNLMVPANVNDQLLSRQYDTGARVMSISWGTSANGYTVDARNVDQFMWDNPDAVVLMAAGNEGDSDDSSNSVGSPATAKNGVGVGASFNSAQSWRGVSVNRRIAQYTNKNSLAGFSSRGPTDDGRLKPDVCGVGALVMTATHESPWTEDVHFSRTRVQGTSFSAPLLAGHAAVVREYFMTGFYPSGSRRNADGFVPSGSLVKAMLVHGAEALTAIVYSDYADTSTSQGDFNQGYGRTQLSNSLGFTNATRDGLTLFVMGAIDNTSERYAELSSSDAPHEYSFTVANVSAPKPIRVTLSYTDYPGAFGTSNALINDLDIELSNSTHTFYPMVTNSDGKYDRKNNLELIILNHPTPGGQYTVKVTPYSIPMGPQPYALVLSGEVGQHSYEQENDSTASNDFWQVSVYTVVIVIAAVILVSVVGVCLKNILCGKE